MPMTKRPSEGECTTRGAKYLRLGVEAVLEVCELVPLRLNRPGGLGKASLESRRGGGWGLVVLAGEPRDLRPEDVAPVLVALLRVGVLRRTADAVPAVAVLGDERIDGRLPIDRV